MDKKDRPVSNHIWKVGDKARIVGNSNSHQFKIGEIAMLVEQRGDGWKAEHLDGHDYWAVKEHDIEPLEDKPRICEVLCKALDVEAGDEFEYGCNKFVIRRKDGLIYCMDFCGDWSRVDDVTEIAKIVEHSDRIIRQPRFTADEAAAMRVLYAAGVVKVERLIDETLVAWIDYQGKNLPPLMLPSIRPGQSVELAQIINQEN